MSLYIYKCVTDIRWCDSSGNCGLFDNFRWWRESTRLIGRISEVSVVFEVEKEDGIVVLLFLNLLVVCFCFILDNHGGRIDITLHLILVILNFRPKISSPFSDLLLCNIFSLFSLVNIHEGLIKTGRVGKNRSAWQVFYMKQTKCWNYFQGKLSKQNSVLKRHLTIHRNKH